MTPQTSDVYGQISALSAVSEHLRNHVFDGSFNKFGIGFEAITRDKLNNIALLLALAPKETVMVTLQNRLKGRDGNMEYGVLAVMEKPDKDDNNMIDLCRTYIAPNLHARHITTLFTNSRGRHQHVEIIEEILLAIHHSWNTMKSLQTNESCSELCEVFFAYTLGMTSAEFRHRLNFGKEEGSFIEFFDSPPPTDVSFTLKDASINKFDSHGERPRVLDEWTKLSRNLKNEVDAFKRDLEMIQDELDNDFKEFARIQSMPGNAYITVANGLVSTKVIALVHIVIHFRLDRILQVFETLEECDGTMQLPWHTGSPATPPPHTLQKELYRAVTNLTGLLIAYQHFLEDRDPKCGCYALPNVVPEKRTSTHSQKGDIQQVQYEKSQTDDDKYDHFRNLPFRIGVMAWLHSLCAHYQSAQNLIRFVKKVSRGELEKSRIVLKLLLPVPKVATNDISLDLVLVNAMEAPKAAVKVQNEYYRITEVLSVFACEDEDFEFCVDAGFLSTQSFGARFFFEMLDSTVLPSERKNMVPVSKKEQYKRRLNSHIRRTYPKIACNRAIPMVTAILMDELLIETYGDIVYLKGIPHEHGIVSRLRCWNKIFATALPARVNENVAERVLANLQRDFRRRLSDMGLENLKQWIAFVKGDVDEMPGVEEEEEYEGDVEMTDE